MDKSKFYLDLLYSVQAALFRIRSEHSITALIAFTYGDLKDLEELLKNEIAKAESNELIDMLTMIKGQAVKNNNDTIIKNIKIDSLKFVIDKVIKALEPKMKGDN